MWEQIRANRRRSVILVAGMAFVMMAVGYALVELMAPGGGVLGLPLALILWTVMTLVSFFAGDRIFLATSGARRLAKQDHPVLWNVVEEMQIAAGLAHMPAVYLIDSEAPNAFATGRGPERSAVAVTSGLLERLTRDELQGVVAHELGHIKNRDVLYLMIAGIMMGTVVMLADIGTRMLFWGGGRSRTSRDGGGNAVLLVISLVLVILAPILAQLLYFALSRKREYLADASAAVYTRYPEGLASALEKISASPQKLQSANRTTAPMFIVNPLAAGGRAAAGLNSTHPPTAERVRILRAFAGESVGLGGYDEAYRRVTGRAVGVVPAGSLAAAAEAEAAVLPIRPAEADPSQHVDRVRQVTDALWHLNSYLFLACVCGTALKVPPVHQGKVIPCPHCGTRLDATPPPPPAA